MQTRVLWIYPLLLLFVLVHGLLATGCGVATSASEDEPLHHHVFCLTSADGQSVTCEGPERLAVFNAWVKEALYRPQSTFSIWAVGPDRSSSRPFFSACIPDKWSSSSSVWQAKASFLERARQGVRANRTEQTLPARCSPETKASGSHQLVVLSPSTSLHPDVWQQVPSTPVVPPLHYAIVCDKSDSTLGATCTPASLLRVFDRWIAEGQAQPGASLSVEMVGPLQDALHAIYHVSVPDLSVEERVAIVLGARMELAQLLEGSGEKYASTIVEAISATVRRLRERNGRYRLFVLSDLHQITSGVWNFEQAVPSSPNFIVWLKKTQRFSDLRNIPVLACGMHTGHFGSYSAAHATRLYDLWQAVFQASGAPEVRLFSSCEAGFAAL